MIYHIATLENWKAQLQDTTHYTPPTFLQEGFIHCSTPQQVEAVANRLFLAEDSLLLLLVDEEKEKDFITYENLRGEPELYPHIYRPLPKSSILEILEWQKKDGKYTMEG